MNIIPDPILAIIQVVPFLVLVAGLHVIIFKPMLDYLHDRGAATVGAKHDAQALMKQAEAKATDYEGQLAKVRAELTEYRAGLRAAAHKVHAGQVAEARRESDENLQGALAGVHAEAAIARQAVSGMAKELSGDIVQSVLGRAVEA